MHVSDRTRRIAREPVGFYSNTTRVTVNWTTLPTVSSIVGVLVALLFVDVIDCTAIELCRRRTRASLTPDVFADGASYSGALVLRDDDVGRSSRLSTGREIRRIVGDYSTFTVTQHETHDESLSRSAGR